MEKLEKKRGVDWSSSGDVKYHLGTSMTRTYPDGRTVHLSLLANPSHLEVTQPSTNKIVHGHLDRC
jgi:2-oxoglutarate dehydrogenase complex dehydrogenase (E1) component-like enzyme